jgi:hypothetical protein
VGQPRNTDPVARGEPDTSGPKLIDYSDHFVSGNYQVVFGREIPLDKVEIGAANTAGPHMDTDLSGSGQGDRSFEVPERSGIDRPRFVDCPYFHRLGRHRSVDRLAESDRPIETDKCADGSTTSPAISGSTSGRA